MSQAQGQPDFDLDEDLFDFAGVQREQLASPEDLEEVFASFRDDAPEEELLAVPSAASSAPPAESEPAITRAATARASVPAAPLPSRAPVAVEPPPIAPAARPVRLSRSVIAIALAVTLMNSVLAVVVLRGRPGDAQYAVDAGRQDEHARDAHAAPPRESATRLSEPETLGPEGALHAHPTLDEAREQISRGEYATARQRVYGLLAIIDRLEDPRRSALEADCQFLIAQSLHLEALARMGGPE